MNEQFTGGHFLYAPRIKYSWCDSFDIKGAIQIYILALTKIHVAALSLLLHLICACFILIRTYKVARYKTSKWALSLFLRPIFRRPRKNIVILHAAFIPRQKAFYADDSGRWGGQLIQYSPFHGRARPGKSNLCMSEHVCMHIALYPRASIWMKLGKIGYHGGYYNISTMWWNATMIACLAGIEFMISCSVNFEHPSFVFGKEKPA